MKKIAIIGLSILALAGCASTASAPTTENIATACGWVQTADVVFKAVVVAKPGTFSEADIANEQTADASATVLCTPPYPTDIETTLTKLLAIVSQIQSVSAK